MGFLRKLYDGEVMFDDKEYNVEFELALADFKEIGEKYEASLDEEEKVLFHRYQKVLKDIMEGIERESFLEGYKKGVCMMGECLIK